MNKKKESNVKIISIVYAGIYINIVSHRVCPHIYLHQLKKYALLHPFPAENITTYKTI